jgi:hypothetical protein
MQVKHALQGIRPVVCGHTVAGLGESRMNGDLGDEDRHLGAFLLGEATSLGNRSDMALRNNQKMDRGLGIGIRERQESVPSMDDLGRGLTRDDPAKDAAVGQVVGTGVGRHVGQATDTRGRLSVWPRRAAYAPSVDVTSAAAVIG